MKVENKDTGEIKEYYGIVQDTTEEERGLVTYHLVTSEEGNMEKIEDEDFKEHFRPYKREI